MPASIFVTGNGESDPTIGNFFFYYSRLQCLYDVPWLPAHGLWPFFGVELQSRLIERGLSLSGQVTFSASVILEKPAYL